MPDVPLLTFQFGKKNYADRKKTRIQFRVSEDLSVGHETTLNSVLFLSAKPLNIL